MIYGVNKQDLQRLLAVQNTNGNVFNESDTYVIEGLFYNYAASSNSMVQVAPDDLFPLEFNPNTRQAQAIQGVQPLIDTNLYTGWGSYADGQYTSGSPFALTQDTDTDLPNNAASKLETQLPIDVTKFYDESTTKITGRNGDGLLITKEFKVVPASATNTYIDVWIDIGGSVGELYRRSVTFNKGIQEYNVHISYGAYTLDTWEANGGQVRVRSNTNCDIYGIRYVLTRTHKARAS